MQAGVAFDKRRTDLYFEKSGDFQGGWVSVWGFRVTREGPAPCKASNLKAQMCVNFKTN